MPKEIARLAQDTPNAAILDAVRGVASTDYQRRIPQTDVAGIAHTIENLTKPENRQWMNEFIDVLVNRIGMTIVRSNSWSNPLSAFKRGMLEFGNTIEEIQVGLLEAHNYDPDRDYGERTLFGRERPEVQVNFHTVNRQDFYKVTINDALLKRAFLDPNGLSGFIQQLMNAPQNSDQWDEFMLTTTLFREYESNGGFHHVHVPDISGLDSDAADAKVALRKMRAMAGNLRFLSTQYNAARMPTFANPEDLLLFVSPEFNAAVDVEALSAAFHIDRAKMYGKVVELPREAFGIDGCEAILTTKDFFVIADTLFETTSQWNPANLHNNYFLHHHQVISASRFVPAVMFHTGADDEVITIVSKPTSVGALSIEPIDGEDVDEVAPGQTVAILGEAVTSEDVGGNDAPAAVVWSVEGATSARTFITQNGALHVAPDETADTLTVRATSAAVDADNPRKDPFTATLAVSVADEPVEGWPEQSAGLTSISFKGIDVPNVTPADVSYDVVVPEGTVIEKRDVKVNTLGSADTNVSVAKNGDLGYTITIAVDKGVGAPVNYTVNVTFA